MRDEEEEDADADGLRARWDLLDFQLEQADAMLFRLQCYLEVGPEPERKDWAEFRCHVTNLTWTTRGFIENFGKAVAVASGEFFGEAAWQASLAGLSPPLTLMICLCSLCRSFSNNQTKRILYLVGAVA
jgi:hypothetical protein